MTGVQTCALPIFEGIPEISLTENILPDNPSEIENSCPAVASKDRVPSSKTLIVVGVLFAPVNLIEGYVPVAAETFGVINIFLSELAMFHLS